MGIGCDIEEIKRFENKTLETDEKFLKRIFTENELNYCFSKNNPAQHLCARFCAKEALIKALSNKTLALRTMEILNNNEGKPEMRLLDIDFKGKIEVSLSHCENYACAFVVVS